MEKQTHVRFQLIYCRLLQIFQMAKDKVKSRCRFFVILN